MEKIKNRSMRKIFSYYRNAVRPYSRYAIATLVLYGCAFACTEILRPYVVKYIIDGTIAHTINWVWAITVFGAVTLLYNIFFRGADYSMTPFQSRISKVLYDESLTRILKHSPLFFVNHSDTGKLITKVRRYVVSFENLFDELTYRVCIMLIYVIGVTTIALLTDYRLGLLLVGFIVVFAYISIIFFRKKMALEEFATDKESAVSSAVSDVLMNVQTIKHYGRTNDELKRFGIKTTEYAQAQYRAGTFANNVRIIKGTSIMIFDTAMVGLICYLYNKNAINVGSMYLFFSYSFQISMALWSLDEALKKITKSIADAGEIVDLFERPLELPNAKDSVQKLPHAAILLDNISFSYGGTKQVFENLSLAIPTGQKVGICGTTGSGKTTLANLILRTMDPTDGIITVGSYSTKNDFSQDGLKQWISYVPQNIDIFNRTIMENIRFADPLASDEEVISAAKRAKLHKFILTLEEKYDTFIGEKGLTLSGGQCQRISIARALLRNTPILILDEATSSLDVMTESEILDILNKEFIGKTVIVIVHRLSTIRNLDRILVLEEGKIVEDGNHHQLMELQGRYFDFIKAQNETGVASFEHEERTVHY